ncbi:MAG TPA: hypothetical protein VNT22_02950 [Baekduia sp.]|nr:hypothetical protein [Baekduia sp.]
MTRTPRKTARAESVGSLIRSPEITRRIDEIFEDATTGATQFALPEKAKQIAEMGAVVDGLLPDLVRNQIDAGLDVVTDGEIRRTGFLDSFYDAVAGVRPPDSRWGKEYNFALADPLVDGRISKARNPLINEIASLRAIDSPAPFKLTIPPPSYFISDMVPTPPSSAYESRMDLVEDVVAIEREMLAEAIAAGATWIQFDAAVYSMLVDPENIPGIVEINGKPTDELLDYALDFDTRVVEGLTDDLTIGVHLCRGNMPGATGYGSIEPVAERMFNELPYDRFLIEWDDLDRFGDFSPLRHVPKGKIVVLGLISTKTPELESEDEIVALLEQASAYIPMDQLAISPQCGFASGSHDHNVDSEDRQWRKLELVGNVADRVWGRD